MLMIPWEAGQNRNFPKPSTKIIAETNCWRLWINKSLMIRKLSRRKLRDKWYSWVICAYFLGRQTLRKPNVSLTINSMTCLLRSDKWLHICIIWWWLDEDMAWKDHISSRLKERLGLNERPLRRKVPLHSWKILWTSRLKLARSSNQERGAHLEICNVSRGAHSDSL